MNEKKLTGLAPPFAEIDSKKNNYLNDFFKFLKKGVLKKFWFWIDEEKKVRRCDISATIIKEIDKLRYLLCQIPEFFPFLEDLSIKLDQLEEIPKEFSNLKHLRNFSFHNDQVQKIPSDFFKLMEKLEHISLRINNMTDLDDNLFEKNLQVNSFVLYANKLENFPKTIRNLEKLKFFVLGNINQIAELPECLFECKNIEEFRINNSTIQYLHESFGNLHNLKKIKVNEVSLKTLPKSIKFCENLESIEIFKAPELETLPEGLGDLPNLKILDLQSCRKLTNLPESLTSNKSLKRLKVVACPNIVIPDDFLERMELLKTTGNLERVLWQAYEW